eukprot:TRINITY_DN7516_c0_g2_i1.p1 TRINITY_DN7516_c0_g2~~TRINITY_DN7516_c0_g2_i1.p1  ORF type:complete len:106 (+),score=21.94 TRINITY_DN7516_c0_g2_i1:283-600(+)
MRSARIATSALLLLSMLSPIDRALARVQDYQVLRLLSYDSECRVEKLGEAQPLDHVGLRYHVVCSNSNAYPQGLDIECRDADDERSCRVLTQAKTFDQLHLLDQH